MHPEGGTTRFWLGYLCSGVYSLTQSLVLMVIDRGESQPQGSPLPMLALSRLLRGWSSPWHTLVWLPHPSCHSRKSHLLFFRLDAHEFCVWLVARWPVGHWWRETPSPVSEQESRQSRRVGGFRSTLSLNPNFQQWGLKVSSWECRKESQLDISLFFSTFPPFLFSPSLPFLYLFIRLFFLPSLHSPLPSCPLLLYLVFIPRSRLLGVSRFVRPMCSIYLWTWTSGCVPVNEASVFLLSSSLWCVGPLRCYFWKILSSWRQWPHH